jgi:phosphomannomutase
MLLARDVLSRKPRRHRHLRREVHAAPGPRPSARPGGVPMMWKTGHSLIKAQDEGDRRAARRRDERPHLLRASAGTASTTPPTPPRALLEILSRSADPSAVLDALPTSHSTPELNVPCAEGEPTARGARRLPATARELPRRGDQHHRRRARRLAPTASASCRASNTTPVLVLRFEGHTRKALARIEADFMAALKAVKPDARIEAAAH